MGISSLINDLNYWKCTQPLATFLHGSICSWLQYDLKYVSIISLKCLVCSSVCGWKALLIRRLISRYSYILFKHCTVNIPSLSDATSSGTQKYIQTSFWWDFATVRGSPCANGSKRAICVNRLNTTRLALCPLDSGRSVMKLVEICIIGFMGNSGGWSNPCFACHGTFISWQLSQLLQFSLTSSSNFGQFRFRDINWNVLSHPKCAGTFQTYSDVISCYLIPFGVYNRFFPPNRCSILQ